MQLRQRQQGLGWFGLLLVLAAIAFVAVVSLKTFPIYMNQMKLASALNKVASDPALSNAEATSVRSSLQRFWDLEDIRHVATKDIKLKRTDQGRFLVYDYEAREHLFYNIHIVLHFQGEVRMTAAAS